MMTFLEKIWSIEGVVAALFVPEGVGVFVKNDEVEVPEEMDGIVLNKVVVDEY